jgi:phosphoribosylamine--glycine ligase
VIDHRLDQLSVEWHQGAAVCVVMTSGGYPGAYQQGEVIAGLPASTTGSSSSVVFHAGTAQRDHDVVTAGGRVLGVLGLGSTLTEAQRQAYRGVDKISFAGHHFRTDIAHRALRR